MTDRKKFRIKLTDKFFRRVFISLLSLALSLTIVITVHFFFDTPLNSVPLWLSIIVLFLGVNLFYSISKILGKLIILVLVIACLSLIFVYMLNWSLHASIQIGLVSVSLVILLYMTFIS